MSAYAPGLMMHRQLLASSAVLVATAAAAAASATIWVTLTQPASAVVALSNGDMAEFLYAVLGAITQALRHLFEYL
jgi:hypothetical protein